MLTKSLCRAHWVRWAICVDAYLLLCRTVKLNLGPRYLIESAHSNCLSRNIASNVDVRWGVDTCSRVATLWFSFHFLLSCESCKACRVGALCFHCSVVPRCFCFISHCLYLLRIVICVDFSVLEGMLSCQFRIAPLLTSWPSRHLPSIVRDHRKIQWLVENLWTVPEIHGFLEGNLPEISRLLEGTYVTHV